MNRENKFFNDIRDQAIPPSDYRVNRMVRKFDINYDDESIKSCISVFRRIPWLKNNVDRILVNPIKMSEVFYDKNNFLEKNGVKFFNVKIPYYRLRCFGKIQSVEEDGTVECIYNDEIVMFQVGFLLKNNVVVQTPEMFKDEQKYLEEMRSNNIDINSYKIKEVPQELISIATIALEDYTQTRASASKIANHVASEFKNSAYNYAEKIATIITAAKYGNIFSKRLKRGYYNEECIGDFDYDILLEGTVYDIEEIENYIDDTTINMLLYLSKYNDIPVRQYKRENIKQLFIPKTDIRISCDNMDEVKNVPEEDLTFLQEGNKYYCYDVKKLYHDFTAGNLINHHTGKEFPEDFVKKIKKIFRFKFVNVPTVEITKEGKQEHSQTDPEFLEALEKVRYEIGILSKDISDKCLRCKKSIGSLGIVTLDELGKVLKYCSRNCFEKF